MNEQLYKDISSYIKRNNLYPGEYLFRSRVGLNRPITRQNAWMRIKQYADECKITYLVGCHSLRKCFARTYYEETGDIIGLQEMLNHSSPRITLVYICWLDEDKKSKRKSFYM